MATSIPPQPEDVPIIDYQQHPEASIWVLPKSATLSSSGENWHFEVQRQPAHHTGEHRHSMHLVTMVTSGTSINQSIDGQLQRNLVGQNNAFILPAGSLHNCNWHRDIEFIFIGLDPHIFVQVGQELINPDRMELVPHFATVEDPLLNGLSFGEYGF